MATELTAIRKAKKYAEKHTKSRPLWVLDVGCASGYATWCRFAKMPGVTVLAVDKDKEALKLAITDHAAKNIRYELKDVLAIPPRSRSTKYHII